MNIRCLGWGTDERALIRILAHRNANQRALICQTYKEEYDEDLIARLHSELSGDFRVHTNSSSILLLISFQVKQLNTIVFSFIKQRAMIHWTLSPAQRDARLANEALKKKNSKQLEVLVEIACATSPDHLILVRKAYCRLFERSLEEDIILYVKPPLRKVSLLPILTFNHLTS